MNLKIKYSNNYPDEWKLKYETPNSAGMDLRAFLPKGSSVQLDPQDRVFISTGIQLEIPTSYEAQIRPRSGLAAKFGITVLNSPGTIDADYRGTIGVILYNASNVVYNIKAGDRIAQIVFAKCEHAILIEEQTLTETERGNGGFGSTGVN